MQHFSTRSQAFLDLSRGRLVVALDKTSNATAYESLAWDRKRNTGLPRKHNLTPAATAFHRKITRRLLFPSSGFATYRSVLAGGRRYPQPLVFLESNQTMTIDTKAKKSLRTTRELSGASTGKPSEQKSKSTLAREAKERGEQTFTAVCIHHGEQHHYASTRACVVCQGKRNEPKNAAAAERYRTDPEYREHRGAAISAARKKRMENPEHRKAANAYNSALQARRRATDPAYAAHMRAKGVNSSAMYRMRQTGRFETAMPNKATLRECAEVVMRAPVGAQLDHAVPLKGLHPVTREWVVSGLHVPHNLEPMSARSNTRKRHWFDPENPLEFQKPRNSFPGGQFHGEIGEIERMRYMVPTTLELWTKDEFRAAAVEAGNTAMEALAA